MAQQEDNKKPEAKPSRQTKMRKGSTQHKEANPSLQDMNSLVTLFAEGRYPEAATLAQAMTVHFPWHGFGWKVLGAVFQQMGRGMDALAPMQRASVLLPRDAEIHKNLGIVLKHLGRLEASEVSCRQALRIMPDYAEAHYNLGNTLNSLGRLEEAVASYRQALQINLDYAEAHNNLGITLKYLGRLDEAEAAYHRALQIKPDYLEALDNLALLLNGQGKPMAALSFIRRSLQIKETGEAKRIFVACVKGLRWTHDDYEIRMTLIRAFNEPWGRPKELARVSTDLIKLNPAIAGCIARARVAWPTRLSAGDLFGLDGQAALAADSLLSTLLNTALICDIEMEHFLALSRYAMLEAAAGLTASVSKADILLSFCCAVARQCFINEYVYSYTDDEIRTASDLQVSLKAALEANAPVPALWPIAVAAYFPLCSFPLATRLLDREWPEAVAAVLVQQIREPNAELQLRKTIPRLTKIEDEVSLLVRDQYEENPYPRWVKAAPVGKAQNIGEYLRRKFPLASFKCADNLSHLDILVAGCGTGQHSIGTVQRFTDAQVLAIDLSLSSLSYAKRKTQELGLTSIEYAQADLLKLGAIGRHFDLIESVGVLHHLADPFAGWRVLLSLLRPGGFMKLGLYSEVARRNIVRIRTFIAAQGYGTSANAIRRCRQDLVDLDQTENFGDPLASSDFFSVSTCRDLLFHVQEHRMSLTSIDTFIRNNNLTLLGFDIDDHVLQAYTKRFPDDRAGTNLGYWQNFENDNPDTFLGMYQFWIQNPLK